jgi:hypothetical protein
MKQLGRVVIGLGLVVAATGCYEHTYTIGTGAPTGPLVYDEWQNHWLGGLIEEKTLDIGALCPSGNATIHDEQSFLNGLVSGLTMGIYTPTMVRIRCDSGGSAQVGLDEGEVMAIVTSPAFLERLERVMPDRLEEARLGVRALEEDRED